MIKIPFTYNGAAVVQQRQLTNEERPTVTSKLINGGTMEVIYYQGDEPVVVPSIVPYKHPLIEMAESMTQGERTQLYNLIKPGP